MPAPTIDPETDQTGAGWSRGAKLQLLLLLGILAMWAAIYGYTLFSGPHERPGRMDDRAFATAAEPICAATEAAIERLGLPTAVETPLERAQLVEAENGLLRTLVADLGALDRPAGEEGEWVEEWLGDWDTHIQDRQNWADSLREGDDGPFVETARNGEQLSKGIDYFAETNDMPACVTPGDV